MNIDNWNYVFKFDYNTKLKIETNLVYTPLTNGKIFCMNFDPTSPYQGEMVSNFLPTRPYYNEETVSFFFKRELEFIELFKDCSWTPNYLEIDQKFKRIFFEWPGKTFNQPVCQGDPLDLYCEGWEDQLLNIIQDISDRGCFKLTIYPHCFFNDSGIVRTFDFYGCARFSDPLMPVERLKGIMGVASVERFNEASSGNDIDLRVLFRQALEGHSKWPSARLKELSRIIV